MLMPGRTPKGTTACGLYYSPQMKKKTNSNLLALKFSNNLKDKKTYV